MQRRRKQSTFPLIIIFLGLIVISMPLQEVYAVAPAVLVAAGSQTLTTTTVRVCFNEANIDFGTTDDADFLVDLAAVTHVDVNNDANCAGNDSVTLTLVAGAFATDATPTIRLVTNSGVTHGGLNAQNAQLEITAADGLAPTFVSATTISSTQITVTYSEAVITTGVVNGDYTYGGIASAPTTTAITGSGTTTLTLTLSAAIVSTDVPTVTYTQTGNALEDAALNDVATHAGSAVTNNVPAVPGRGGCSGDCEAPTLGMDSEYNRKVTDGFSYNGVPTDVERFFTPYPLITVNVGETNQAIFKIYENHGPQNVKHFSLAFGLGSGQIISLSKAMIELDIDFDGTETVTITDPENALENVTVKTSTGDCNGDSVIECLIVTIDHTFRAPLEFNIVGTDVWDMRRNSWQNYYNHGIEVVGESLNPPNEYFGIYKGKLIHLIETAKNTAIDADGNTWTFDNTWIKDYILQERITDGHWKVMERHHSEFSKYKQEQADIAQSKLESLCPQCSDKPFEEINDIFSYEFPEESERLNAEVQKTNLEESKIAQQMMNQYSR